MEQKVKGRHRKQEVVKTSKKVSIHVKWDKPASLVCGFCYPPGFDKNGNPLPQLRRGQYKKRHKSFWHLKCHIEYHHRDEFIYPEVIDELRRGVVPSW